MRTKLIYLLLAVFAILSSCELIVDLTTDDSEIQLEYKINHAIERLELRADMDLELIDSDDSVLIIQGPKALLDELEIVDTSGVMTLKYDTRGDWRYKKTRIKYYMPDLRSIASYADNEITCRDTLHYNSLNIFSDGTSDIYLSVNNNSLYVFANNISNFYIEGKTKKLRVLSTFGSSFRGAGLKAEQVTVTSLGSNFQVVYPLEKLTCTIGLDGDVYYVNKPNEITVNTEEGASGKVIFDASKR